MVVAHVRLGRELVVAVAAQRRVAVGVQFLVEFLHLLGVVAVLEKLANLLLRAIGHEVGAFERLGPRADVKFLWFEVDNADLALVDPPLEFATVGCNRRRDQDASHLIGHGFLHDGLFDLGDLDLWVGRHHHELGFVEAVKLLFDVDVTLVPPTLDHGELADQAIVDGVVEDVVAAVLAIEDVVDELGGLPCCFDVLVCLRRELDHAPVGGEGVEDQCLGRLDGVEHVSADVLTAARLLVPQRLAVVIAVRAVALLADQRLRVGVCCVEVALQQRQQFFFVQRIVFNLRHSKS